MPTAINPICFEIEGTLVTLTGDFERKIPDNLTMVKVSPRSVGDTLEGLLEDFTPSNLFAMWAGHLTALGLQHWLNKILGHDPVVYPLWMLNFFDFEQGCMRWQLDAITLFNQQPTAKLLFPGSHCVVQEQGECKTILSLRRLDAETKGGKDRWDMIIETCSLKDYRLGSDDYLVWANR